MCEEDLPLVPRPTFQFSETAKVLIVGQAPGVRAHESGLPFNDPSGDRLRQWLGVNEEEFYDANKFALLPMAFCYPGGGKSGDLPPSKRCAPTWRRKLLDELSEIRFTLLCGKYARDWHLPDERGKSLTSTVEQWRHLKPGLIVTPHPSGRNSGWLKRNSWFGREVVPEIQKQVQMSLE